MVRKQDTFLHPLDHLSLSHIYSASSGLIKGSSFSKSLLGASCFVVISEDLYGNLLTLPEVPVAEPLELPMVWNILVQNIIMSWRFCIFAPGSYPATCLTGWLFRAELILPLVLWRESLSMQGHCSTDRGVLLVSPQGTQAFGPCG